jgi:anaerobic magnesium-protoporphyrin IX monomethyl ester cyclase
MRVLLTSPVSQDPLRTVAGITTPPLGLAYLATVAEQAGHTVRILDAAVLGLSPPEMTRDILAWQPDLLGISATTLGYTDAVQLAQNVRQHRPEPFIVLGGPHVSFLDEQTLHDCPPVDAVVRGEGEETFRELLERVDARADLAPVRGLTWRAGDRIVRNLDRPFVADLDTIGPPAFHLLPMDRYRLDDRKPFATLITSRGCPYQCTFCSSSALFGKRWRFHSPERVVGEMELLRRRYGMPDLEILDDTFTVNLERVHAICDLLIRKNLGIVWTASARVGTVTLELARKLRQAGCMQLFLGFESASQEVLDSLCKGVRVEQAWETMSVLRRAGIDCVGSFILGSPADTRATIRATIRMARKLAPAYVQFTLLTPYPGTVLYEQARAAGWLAEMDWSRFSMMMPTLKHPTIPARALRNSIYWAYISFYLGPRHLWHELRSGDFYCARRALKGLLELALHRQHT